MRRSAYLAGLAILVPASLAAQEGDETATAIDAKAEKRLESAVPDQPWYPAGYRDIRMAAEAESGETARSRDTIVRACDDRQCYEIIDPDPQRIASAERDAALRRYGDVALDVSRIRQELSLVGYPLDIYAGPLADYERQRIADAAGDPPDGAEFGTLVRLSRAIEERRARLASGLPRITLLGANPEKGGDGALVVRSAGPSAQAYPAGRRVNEEDKLLLRTGDSLVLLGARGTRKLTGPGVFSASGPPPRPTAQIAKAAPRRVAMGAARGFPPGGSRPGIVVATSPIGGEVLLVSAFAFKLCSLKQRDAWDRFKCQWNEIETGVGQPLSGRYVYQVRWPDGTVRKGTRQIVPSDGGAVTFKKTGS